MDIRPFHLNDIQYLKEMQPPGWPDLRPYYEYHISHAFCDPIAAWMDDKVVGIGASIQHGDTAWLAQIITHPDYRNRRIGNTITHSLIERLDTGLFQTIYLDATDLGYPVYKNNGFDVEIEYAHYDCKDIHSDIPVSPLISPFDEEYRTAVLQLDRDISGEIRNDVLDEHIPSTYLYIDKNELQAVYFPTLYDGLIISATDEAGIAMMKLRLQTNRYASVPVANEAAISFLKNNKASLVRTSRRMINGKRRPWKPANLFNRISGALG